MIQVNPLGPTLVLCHLLSMLTCEGAVMGASRCRPCTASLMRTDPASGQALNARVLDGATTIATADTARRRAPREAADAQTFGRSSE